jgi:hypothetical protein
MLLKVWELKQAIVMNSIIINTIVSRKVLDDIHMNACKYQVKIQNPMLLVKKHLKLQKSTRIFYQNNYSLLRNNSKLRNRRYTIKIKQSITRTINSFA